MANDIQSMKPNTAKIENLKTGKLTVEMADDDSKTVIDGGKIEAGAVHIPSVWVDHHFDGFHSEDPMVEHPAHYASGTLECIEWIESELSREEYEGYLKGNVLKYLWRYPDKGGVQDIEKAMWYLNELRDALRRWKLLDECEDGPGDRVASSVTRTNEESPWFIEAFISQDELEKLEEWLAEDRDWGETYYSVGHMERLVGRRIFPKLDDHWVWSFTDLMKAIQEPRVDCRSKDPYVLYLPYPSGMPGPEREVRCL